MNPTSPPSNILPLLQQTQHALAHLQLPASTQFLQSLLSQPASLPLLFPHLVNHNGAFFACHLLCDYILDGYEANHNHEGIRHMLVEFLAQLITRNDTWSVPQGDRRATLLKAIVAWDRIVLQKLKIMRSEAFSLQELLNLYGVQQYSLRISWNLQSVQNEPQHRELRYALLLALAHLPEEASRDHFSRPQNVAIKHLLQNVAPQVLSFLLEYICHFDWTQFGVAEAHLAHELQRRALEAIQKWLQFGVPLDMIYNDRFLGCIFQCLKQRPLFKETVDLILEAFLTYADSKHDRFILRCMDQVCALLPLYEETFQSLQQPQQSGTSVSEHSDLIHHIVRLVVGFAENQVRLIAEHTREEACQRLVEFVGVCCQNPSLSICALTFDFWYSLQSRLRTEEDKQRFKGIFVALLASLVSHVQYNPNDMESKDDVDQFREEAKDVFMEPYSILYGEYFTILHRVYRQALQERDWSRFEALLFALCAAGEMANADQLNTDFFEMVNTFPKLQVRDVPILRRTLSGLLRAYSDVLQRKVSLEFIGWALNFFLDGVWQFCEEAARDDEFASSAGEPMEAAIETAEAFLEFCEKSENHLSRAGDMVTELVKACLSRVNPLPFQVVQMVFDGLAHCVASLESTSKQQFESNFNALFTFCERRLRQRVSDTSTASHNMELLIAHDIELVTKILQPFDGKHPHVFILQKIQQIWDLTVQILMQFSKSSIIIDALAKLYFVMFVAVGIHRESQVFLHSMMDLLTQYFAHFMHPPVVRLISFMVDGSVDRSILDLYSQRFPALATLIMQSLSAHTIEQLQNHSEMMRHFFKLLIKTLHVCPNALESNVQVLEGIFALGLAAISVEDRELSLQVVSWYTTFLNSEMSPRHLKDMAGPLITKVFTLTLVDRMIFAPYLGSIVEYFKRNHPLMLQAFALNVLMRDEFVRIPLEEKKRFLRDLNQTVTLVKQQELIRRFIKELDVKSGRSVEEDEEE